MDETAIVVALVLGLLIGSAFGYFGYRAMNDEPAPQPQAGDHNHPHVHLGLWGVLIVTIILGATTSRAFWAHLNR